MPSSSRSGIRQGAALGQVQRLRHLWGFPRPAGPKRHRGRDDLRARPLARADGAGGDGGGQGRLAGEAHHPLHRRGPQLADDGRQQSGRIFRVDSELRSYPHIVQAAELVRNGRIGKVHTVTVGVPGSDVGCPPQPDMPVPDGVGLRALAGAGPAGPVHRETRPQTQGIRPPRLDAAPLLLRRHDYQLDDPLERRGHVCTGLERTGPVEIEGTGEYPPADSFWNVLLEVRGQDAIRQRRPLDLPDRKAVLQDRGERRLDLRRLYPAPGRAPAAKGIFTSPTRRPSRSLTPAPDPARRDPFPREERQAGLHRLREDPPADAGAGRGGPAGHLAGPPGPDRHPVGSEADRTPKRTLRRQRRRKRLDRLPIHAPKKT